MLIHLKSWQENAIGEPPRILIHPVVVSGTYDDHNWQVLKARWMELRVQLHGEVLPKQAMRSGKFREVEALRQRIQTATPSFAPKDLK